jgi:hypothetical protein
MKKSYISVVLIMLIAGIGCKKTTSEYIPVVTPPPPASEKKWVVTTIAGDGTGDFADGPALSARFKNPLDVVVTTEGMIYVADAFNHRIRKLAGGQVTTFAGNGNQDTISGQGTAARFAIPSRLTIDMNGNLYTLDASDPRVRKITPAGFVSVYAGTGVPGFKDGATSIAQFAQGFGIVTDAEGNIYIADSQNRRIRRISTAGQVSTIAGTGASGVENGAGDIAQFIFAAGTVRDKDGNLFVADQNRIRKITPGGVVSTFVGNVLAGYVDGQPDQAMFSLIEDMVIDGQGNIYVSENNHIRKISPQGIVSTIAGTTEGFKDGDGTVAQFNIVQGLGIDGQGNIYVADLNNNRIRKISFE